jgi:hypothetical protein
MNDKIVIGTVVGLIVGLVLGVFVGVMFISPKNTGVETNNQVQVSGYINDATITKIMFVSLANRNISTSASITNHGYEAIILGGQSYTVYLYNSEGLSATSTLYVPSGVAYFTTANF